MIEEPPAMNEPVEEQQEPQEPFSPDSYAYDLSTRIYAGLNHVRQIYGSGIADLLSLLREEMRLYATNAALAAAKKARDDWASQPFVYPVLPAPTYPSWCNQFTPPFWVICLT